MIKKLGNYLLRGLLIVLPLGATFLLCWKIYEILDSIILSHIHNLLKWLGFPFIPLLEILVLAVFLIGVGVFGGNYLGQKFLEATNFLVKKIPLIRVIYSTIQQIIETVFKKNKQAFSKVALVEYPRKGMYCIGFITAETGGVVASAVSEKCWSIFIPTTPNPTSGFLIFVPKEEVKVLDMPVDQAAKLVMSAGVLNEENEG